MRRLLAPVIAATISLSLSCTASDSLFCERWIRNTIRNVTMVVPVLMTSCQVSEYLNIGPVRSHAKIIAAAIPKAQELPDHAVTRRDACSITTPIFERGGAD